MPRGSLRPGAPAASAAQGLEEGRAIASRKAGGTDRERDEAGAAPETVDGRHRRAARSRERILEALEELVAEPGAEPTPERVAARAGVSLSTVFRHFGDVAGLAAAMRARVEARVLPHLLGGPYPGDRAARIRELVRRLATAYATVAPFHRLSMRRRGRSEEAARLAQRLGTAMRSNLRSALAPELAAAPDRETALAALLSFEAWTHLHDVAGLPPERIPGELEAAVRALLAGSPGTSRE